MRADCAFELYLKLEPQIDERGFRKIYEEIDLPLADVLRRMEQTGIRVEPSQLSALSSRMDVEMQRLAQQIHRNRRSAVQHQFAAATGEGACTRI